MLRDVLDPIGIVSDHAIIFIGYNLSEEKSTNSIVSIVRKGINEEMLLADFSDQQVN